MNFTVAQYADEVDEAYIRKALAKGYTGTGYVNKFSDKLVRVLLSDYHKKADNLAWLLKDEAGRIRNYISMATDDATILQNARQNINYIQSMVDTLKTLGATYTPKEFLANRCTMNKQSMKISKALADRPSTIPYSLKVYTQLNKSGRLVAVRYASTKVKLSTSRLQVGETQTVLFKSSSKELIEDILPSSALVLESKDSLSGLSRDNFTNIISGVVSSQLTLSIDLADMITCSTGDCRSCLSVDNIHAAGAIQNFRTEFSLIAFTAGKDRLSKKGRTWVFARGTERGHIRQLPFWKLQKAYGSVTSTHQSMLHDFIGDRMRKLTKKSFTSYEGLGNYSVTPNVSSNISGASHTYAPGYIDTSANGATAWRIPRNITFSPNRSREVLLPFKDMLDLTGEVSNITSFHHSKNNNDYYGAFEPNKYEVTCVVTNTKILDCDAVKIEGQWYRKDILPQLLNGAKDVKIEVAEKVVNPTIDEEYSDVDLDEDF